MHSALQIANEIIRRGAAETPRLFHPNAIAKAGLPLPWLDAGLYGRPLIKEDVRRGNTAQSFLICIKA